eukprot:SAG22_NODE_2124_length_2974_cov_13.089043_4_plen_79_part_00
MSYSAKLATGHLCVLAGTWLTRLGCVSVFVWQVIGIGVLDGDSDFEGMVKAGISTGIGFSVAQTVQNMIVPHGQCWLD